MHYYIDGYNMLFRKLHAGGDLRTQREALIDELQKKINFIALDATLVFDSQYHPDEGASTYIDALELVFTEQGETADEYILQEIKEDPNPENQTVVTSDKKLAWLCRRRLAKTITVEEFAVWLNKRYRNKIRQKKEKALLPSPSILEQKKVLVPKEKDPFEEPKPRATVEECYDYYLHTFELQVAKEPEKPKKAKKKKVGHTPKKPVEDPKETELSDMERWERLFTQKERATEEEL